MDKERDLRIVGTEDRKAILYEEDVDVRFSDLDPYGHVNSKHYIDYVLASRWLFLARKRQMTIEECLKRGLGFYMVRSEMEYKKAISGVDRVHVKSFVSELVRVRLTVTFDMMHPTSGMLYSTGKLYFAMMDVVSGRPQTCPDWAIDLFSEKLT